MDESRAKELAGHAIGGHVVRFIESAIDLGLVALLRENVLPEAKEACTVLGYGAMVAFNQTVCAHTPVHGTSRCLAYNRLLSDLGILFPGKEINHAAD